MLSPRACISASLLTSFDVELSTCSPSPSLDVDFTTNPRFFLPNEKIPNFFLAGSAVEELRDWIDFDVVLGIGIECRESLGDGYVEVSVETIAIGSFRV